MQKGLFTCVRKKVYLGKSEGAGRMLSDIIKIERAFLVTRLLFFAFVLLD